LEEQRAKEGDFIQFRQEVSRQFTERRNKEISEQINAIGEATAAIAKDKKADVVINKISGAVYVNDDIDITQAVLDRLNAAKK
jgi:Skp family chaperone for outer membrane proteins